MLRLLHGAMENGRMGHDCFFIGSSSEEGAAFFVAYNDLDNLVCFCPAPEVVHGLSGLCASLWFGYNVMTELQCKHCVSALCQVSLACF